MIAHLIRSKGASAILRRGRAIMQRVGFSSGAMTRALFGFAALAARYNARVTFPVTALTLQRHEALLRRLVEVGGTGGASPTVELAVHGWRHVDHSLLAPAALQDEVARALAVFEHGRFPVTGFRAPYLRWNEALLAELARAGLAYDSSQPILWPVVDVAGLAPAEQAAVRTLLAFDRPVPAAEMAALPRRIGPLLEIPVSFPDDEMLVERLHLTDGAQMASYWIAAFDMCHARGECFVLQVHPERFPQCATAIERLLQHASGVSGGVWLASLGDVCRWTGQGREARQWPGGAQSALVLSGDIDAITLWDYASRVWGR